MYQQAEDEYTCEQGGQLAEGSDEQFLDKDEGGHVVCMIAMVGRSVKAINIRPKAKCIPDASARLFPGLLSTVC
jgi:hypothetical protein